MFYFPVAAFPHYTLPFALSQQESSSTPDGIDVYTRSTIERCLMPVLAGYRPIGPSSYEIITLVFCRIYDSCMRARSIRRYAKLSVGNCVNHEARVYSAISSFRLSLRTRFLVLHKAVYSVIAEKPAETLIDARPSSAEIF